MDLKYNFSKAIQILTAIFSLTRNKKFTTIGNVHKETLLTKVRIREIVKVLKRGNILAGVNGQVWFEKDPNKLTFKEIKQVLGKEEIYLYYQSKDIEEQKIKPFKQILAEKFAEVEETVDFYWEHLTIAGFQNDLNSLHQKAS